MKTLFVKQKYDITGPVYDCSFNAEQPLDILKLFKWKSGHPFQLGLQLNFDFKIVENHKLFSWQGKANLIKDNRIKEINNFYEGITIPSIHEINFDDYDLIFTSNPFIPKSIIEKNKSKLFISEPAEHWDESIYLYDNSYDLMWNHTPKAAKHQIPTKELRSAKKSFNRPYLTSLDNMRSIFKNYMVEKDKVFIGWRTSNLMSKKTKEYFLQELNKINLEPYFTGVNPFDKKDKNNAVNYWINLSSSKYYLDLTCRLGQQLQDSAVVGVINIGNAWKKELIHENCYISKVFKEDSELKTEDVDNFMKIIKSVNSNLELQNEILEYQSGIILKDERKSIKKLLKNKKIKNKV